MHGLQVLLLVLDRFTNHSPIEVWDEIPMSKLPSVESAVFIF